MLHIWSLPRRPELKKKNISYPIQIPVTRCAQEISKTFSVLSLQIQTFEDGLLPELNTIIGHDSYGLGALSRGDRSTHEDAGRGDAGVGEQTRRNALAAESDDRPA